MKRFVQTLRLKDTPGTSEEYVKAHREIWPEITKGIKEVGIELMDIYLLGNLAVMIVEMADNVNDEEAFQTLSTLPRQKEWEEFVSRFQECRPEDTSAQKWKRMDKVFSLPR